MEQDSSFSLNMITDFFSSQDFYIVIGIPVAILLIAIVTILSLRVAKKKRDERLLKEITEGDFSVVEEKPRAQERKTIEAEDAWVVPDKPEKIQDPEPTPEPKPSQEFEVEAEPVPSAPIPEAVPTPAAPSAPIPAVETPVTEIQKQDHASWLNKLRTGLGKTRDQLGNSLRQALLGKVKLDDDTIEQIQYLLYKADVGVQTADEFVEKLQKTLQHKDLSDFTLVKKTLRDLMNQVFVNTPTPAIQFPEGSPLVILVVGVNGVGKTTSIGKLAANFMAQGKSVLLCAGDTFRAAAIDQLKIWGERVGCPVVAHQPGSDPAAVAYDAVKAAMSRNYDVLLIDTAGRLHNKNDLMQELNKINRIIGRDLPGAPQETWIVIDATTGQNAFHQLKSFQEVVKLSGIVLTKLDGTAKGGVALGLTNQFQVPIRYIGVGEKASDLQAFDSADFTASILDE